MTANIKYYTHGFPCLNRANERKNEMINDKMKNTVLMISNHSKGGT